MTILNLSSFWVSYNEIMKNYLEFSVHVIMSLINFQKLSNKFVSMAKSLSLVKANTIGLKAIPKLTE